MIAVFVTIQVRMCKCMCVYVTHPDLRTMFLTHKKELMMGSVVVTIQVWVRICMCTRDPPR